MNTAHCGIDGTVETILALKSGLENAPIRWLVDDCLKFIEREIRRGRQYDALIMDPPAYGHGPNGEVWNIQKNLQPFIERTVSLLSDSPLFVLVNTYTEKLASINLAVMLRVALQEKFGGIVSAQELGLPVSDTNFVLPCGMTGRWSIYWLKWRYFMKVITIDRGLVAEAGRLD